MTPKIAIHALVAKHQDGHRCVRENVQHINRTGFHCAIDNLVVELPFVYTSVSIAVGIAPCFPVHRAGMPVAPLAFSHPLFGLRGPPAFFMN